LGIHFSMVDFKTAADLRTSTIATVLDRKQWYRLTAMNPAITVSYFEGISNYLDFQGRLTTGFLKYPYRNPAFTPTSDRFYAEADANVNLKMLSDKYIVVPYLQAGVGASLAYRTFNAQIPLGAGLQFKISDETFVHLNSVYRVPVTDRANYSLFHSLGIVAPIVSRPAPPVEVKPVIEPEIPKDRDGDGVLDSVDVCPDVKGLASLEGCPDSDNDGIADQKDKCPTVPGIAKYEGCPIPDSDNDGINDENDKCPNVAGVARYEGCPIPDGDNDGVNDEEDKCPAVSGDPANGGCPKITYEAAPILFGFNSDYLTPASKAELDKAVTFLNEHPDFKFSVTGFTDHIGDEKYNLALSNFRTKAVVNYIVSKGIEKDRLVPSGLGSAQPVGNNATREGRKQNRRVEVKISE
jgi:OOP family OmpA-OmpF porin